MSKAASSVANHIYRQFSWTSFQSWYQFSLIHYTILKSSDKRQQVMRFDEIEFTFDPRSIRAAYASPMHCARETSGKFVKPIGTGKKRTLTPDRRNNRGIYLYIQRGFQRRIIPLRIASNRATGSRIREETKPKKHNAPNNVGGE